MSRRTRIIRQEIEDREIPYLLHFTLAENIPSILKNGIQSREAFPTHSHPEMQQVLASDVDRLDGCDGAISVSLPAFWWEMFQGKRDRSPNYDWVFLALTPDLLWSLECHFYAGGAGNGSSKFHARTAGTTKAFLELFEDRDPYNPARESSFRHAHYLPDCFPTFPLSEIQVWEAIPSDAIIGAFFLDDVCHDRFAPEFENLKHQAWIKKAWMGSRKLSAKRSWGYVERSLEPGPSAEHEYRMLYEDLAHEDGAPAYLGDGVYLYPPED
ncbi:DUF4433 domain-containing protein [Roseovarius spongiae]|uniref:DUF4433 domain-containing protein n=1 Tax=Roseovarius spongiae TaxID=2320272 RepID=A0A3A8AZ77_9RHOB|nr:DarT ssDNA thymidine ADP-ribosyltransferase family protein [Roseovarius spongiae]RKF16879.1 DUF4433 domain-containing protein [Roseovarius spongiae]